MWKDIHNALSDIRIWAMRPVGFLVIWITMTVAAAIWAARQASAPKIQRAREGSINLTLARQVATRRAVVAVILLAIFLVFYIALFLLGEDSASDDSGIFTKTPLVGHNIAPKIWGGGG